MKPSTTAGLVIQGLCPLIQVFDMPQSLAFFRDLLGFEVVAQNRPGDDCDWVWLKTSGGELMLNTRYEKSHRPAARVASWVAAHDDICFYLGTPGVDRTYAYLHDKGLDVQAPRVAPYGMKQLFLRDPDGYGLCFQWPAEQSRNCE